MPSIPLLKNGKRATAAAYGVGRSDASTADGLRRKKVVCKKTTKWDSNNSNINNSAGQLSVETVHASDEPVVVVVDAGIGVPSSQPLSSFASPTRARQPVSTDGVLRNRKTDSKRGIAVAMSRRNSKPPPATTPTAPACFNSKNRNNESSAKSNANDTVRSSTSNSLSTLKVPPDNGRDDEVHGKDNSTSTIYCTDSPTSCLAQRRVKTSQLVTTTPPDGAVPFRPVAPEPREGGAATTTNPRKLTLRRPAATHSRRSDAKISVMPPTVFCKAASARSGSLPSKPMQKWSTGAMAPLCSSQLLMSANAPNSERVMKERAAAVAANTASLVTANMHDARSVGSDAAASAAATTMSHAPARGGCGGRGRRSDRNAPLTSMTRINNNSSTAKSGTSSIHKKTVFSGRRGLHNAAALVPVKPGSDPVICDNPRHGPSMTQQHARVNSSRTSSTKSDSRNNDTCDDDNPTVIDEGKRTEEEKNAIWVPQVVAHSQPHTDTNEVPVLSSPAKEVAMNDIQMTPDAQRVPPAPLSPESCREPQPDCEAPGMAATRQTNPSPPSLDFVTAPSAAAVAPPSIPHPGVLASSCSDGCGLAGDAALVSVVSNLQLAASSPHSLLPAPPPLRAHASHRFIHSSSNNNNPRRMCTDNEDMSSVAAVVRCGGRSQLWKVTPSGAVQAGEYAPASLVSPIASSSILAAISSPQRQTPATDASRSSQAGGHSPTMMRAHHTSNTRAAAEGVSVTLLNSSSGSSSPHARRRAEATPGHPLLASSSTSFPTSATTAAVVANEKNATHTNMAATAATTIPAMSSSCSDRPINERVKLGHKALIGKGSFGLVFQAMDRDTNRLIAVKEITLGGLVEHAYAALRSSHGGAAAAAAAVLRQNAYDNDNNSNNNNEMRTDIDIHDSCTKNGAGVNKDGDDEDGGIKSRGLMASQDDSDVVVLGDGGDRVLLEGRPPSRSQLQHQRKQKSQQRSSSAAVAVAGDGEGWDLDGYVDYDDDTEAALAAVDVTLSCSSSGPLHQQRHWARQQRQLAAVRREIALLRQLDHPNIVKCLGSSVEDGCLRIYMEYIAGGSISALIKIFGPFEEQQAALFTEQVLQGLVYLHSKGIVHRDLKGDNLLVDPMGVLKLADFGTARSMQAITTNNALAGTVFFIAPEVIQGSTSTDPKSDIWSLGCCVIEMLTGAPPLSQLQNQYSVMMLIAEAGEELVQQHYLPRDHRWSPAAVQFICACLARQPEQRPGAEALLRHPWIVQAIEQRDSAGGVTLPTGASSTNTLAMRCMNSAASTVNLGSTVNMALAPMKTTHDATTTNHTADDNSMTACALLMNTNTLASPVTVAMRNADQSNNTMPRPSSAGTAGTSLPSCQDAHPVVWRTEHARAASNAAQVDATRAGAVREGVLGNDTFPTHDGSSSNAPDSDGDGATGGSNSRNNSSSRNANADIPMHGCDVGMVNIATAAAGGGSVSYDGAWAGGVATSLANSEARLREPLLPIPLAPLHALRSHHPQRGVTVEQRSGGGDGIADADDVRRRAEQSDCGAMGATSPSGRARRRDQRPSNRRSHPHRDGKQPPTQRLSAEVSLPLHEETNNSAAAAEADDDGTNSCSRKEHRYAKRNYRTAGYENDMGSGVQDEDAASGSGETGALAKREVSDGTSSIVSPSRYSGQSGHTTTLCATTLTQVAAQKRSKSVRGRRHLCTAVVRSPTYSSSSSSSYSSASPPPSSSSSLSAVDASNLTTITSSSLTPTQPTGSSSFVTPKASRAPLSTPRNDGRRLSHAHESPPRSLRHRSNLDGSNAGVGTMKTPNINAANSSTRNTSTNNSNKSRHSKNDSRNNNRSVIAGTSGSDGTTTLPLLPLSARYLSSSGGDCAPTAGVGAAGNYPSTPSPNILSAGPAVRTTPTSIKAASAILAASTIPVSTTGGLTLAPATTLSTSTAMNTRTSSTTAMPPTTPATQNAIPRGARNCLRRRLTDGTSDLPSAMGAALAEATMSAMNASNSTAEEYAAVRTFDRSTNATENLSFARLTPLTRTSSNPIGGANIATPMHLMSTSVSTTAVADNSVNTTTTANNKNNNNNSNNKNGVSVASRALNDATESAKTAQAVFMPSNVCDDAMSVLNESCDSMISMAAYGGSMSGIHSWTPVVLAKQLTRTGLSSIREPHKLSEAAVQAKSEMESERVASNNTANGGNINNGRALRPLRDVRPPPLSQAAMDLLNNSRSAPAHATFSVGVGHCHLSSTSPVNSTRAAGSTLHPDVIRNNKMGSSSSSSSSSSAKTYAKHALTTGKSNSSGNTVDKINYDATTTVCNNNNTTDLTTSGSSSDHSYIKTPSHGIFASPTHTGRGFGLTLLSDAPVLTTPRARSQVCPTPSYPKLPKAGATTPRECRMPLPSVPPSSRASSSFVTTTFAEVTGTLHRDKD